MLLPTGQPREWQVCGSVRPVRVGRSWRAIHRHHRSQRGCTQTICKRGKQCSASDAAPVLAREWRVESSVSLALVVTSPWLWLWLRLSVVAYSSSDAHQWTRLHMRGNPGGRPNIVSERGDGGKASETSAKIHDHRLGAGEKRFKL